MTWYIEHVLPDGTMAQTYVPGDALDFEYEADALIVCYLINRLSSEKWTVEKGDNDFYRIKTDE